MKRWEFLIQKEGDRDWLTLKEPVVDLEAGKYRLVAQSNCAHLEVEIRLTYQKDSQKFYRRSNSEGLITILPLMELQPGLWELHCYGDLMSELLGECRQENLQLKVFSKSKTSNQKIQFPSTNPKAELYLQQLEQLLLQEIEPMLGAIETSEELFLEPGDRLIIEADESSEFSASLPMFSEPLYPLDWDELFDEPVSENIASQKTIQERPLTLAKLAAQELRVILERETFARKKGDAIAISGRIEAVKPTPSNHLESVILDKLLYELRNPQTGEICIALVQAIGETSLPYIFESRLEISSEWEVSLLIGTVILETAAGLTVIRQPFIITTDLKEEVLAPPTPQSWGEQSKEKQSKSSHLGGFKGLPKSTNIVDSTKNCSKEEEVVPTAQHSNQYAIPNTENELSRTIHYLLAQEAKSPPQNLDLPEPNKMTRKLQHLQSASEPPILPPKLSQATTETRSLQLPPLPKLQTTVSSTDISESLSESAEIGIDDSLTEINQPQASVEKAFDALPLKERFLFRLNSLAKPKKSVISNQ